MNKRENVFRITLLLLSFFALQILAVSCDSAKSRAKKIIALRNERNELIDKLYTEYGGSDLVNAVKEDLNKGQNTQPPEGKEVLSGLGSIARNVDRDFFEDTLRAIGQGEKGVFFSERARDFFSRPDVRKKAQKLNEIEIELVLLERENP